MSRRLAFLLALAAFAAAGCATTATDASKADPGERRPTAFESWSMRNATGAFFAPIGPAGGSGVRSSWP
jgi:hypothetical protein